VRPGLSKRAPSSRMPNELHVESTVAN
jgi:hypothetical protein